MLDAQAVMAAHLDAMLARSKRPVLHPADDDGDGGAMDWTPEMDAAIADLWETNTATDIGQVLKVSGAAVKNRIMWLRRRGVNLPLRDRTIRSKRHVEPLPADGIHASVRALAASIHVDPALVASKSQNARAVKARMAMAWHLVRRRGLKLSEAARRLKRHHATVIHALGNVDDRRHVFQPYLDAMERVHIDRLPLKPSPAEIKMEG